MADFAKTNTYSDGKHSIREKKKTLDTGPLLVKEERKTELALDFQQGLNICRATPLEKVHFTLIKPTLPIREKDQEKKENYKQGESWEFFSRQTSFETNVGQARCCSLLHN